METAARQDDFQALSKTLQECLHTNIPEDIRFQVQCVLRQESLWVLAQHRASQVPNPQMTLEVLQQAILDASIEFRGPVKLFLKVVEQKRPYAFHAFERIDPEVDSPEESEAVTTSEIEASEAETAIIHLERSPDPDPELEQPPLKPSRAPLSLKNLPLKLALAGAGVGVISFAASFYLLSRPCTVGRCELLQTSQTWSKDAAETAQTALQVADILAAQKQLTLANKKLDRIPWWSKSYDLAQQLIEANQVQLASLDSMIAAMSKGMEAAVKSQNPPHPIQKWQEIQSLWQSAIATLAATPPESYGYAFAQKRIRDYRKNLETVATRIDREKQAQAQMAAAQSAARIATARQGVAQSPEDWLLVQNTWATAVNAVKEIPSGTMAHQEGQSLINVYLAGLDAARDRQTQEQLATQLYNQSLNFAQNAKNYEQQAQYSLAVSNWQNALTYAQQIPDSTYYSVEIAPLIEEYSAALATAQDQLRVATALQQTRVDLARSCTASPTICTYDITNSRITVKLTPDYVRTVRQTFIAAGTTGDTNTLTGVDEHIQTLQSALEIISQNAGIPLEIYDPYGQLMGTYVPRT